MLINDPILGVRVPLGSVWVKRPRWCWDLNLRFIRFHGAESSDIKTIYKQMNPFSFSTDNSSLGYSTE
jgi:hypothetical protein